MKIKISNLEDERLSVYTSANESQCKHYFEPDPGLFIAESPKVILRALNAGYKPYSALMEENRTDPDTKKLLDAFCQVSEEFPIFEGPSDVLKNLTGFSLTRGALCAMYRKINPPLSEVLKNARRVVVLEDVDNPTNVGAIIRSAAALQMDAIILTPDCADPLYRRASRVSMGCCFQILWTVLSKKELAAHSINELLHAQGFQTVSMALRDHSIDITDPSLKEEPKLAIFMGSEGNGLKSSTIDESDYVIKIPMREEVDSLNVAAASAIAFWELSK